MKARHVVALCLGAVVLTLVVAQELGDGWFRNLTLGDGTAQDLTITFDEDSATTRRIFWDNTNDWLELEAGSTDMVRIDAAALEIIRNGAPTIGFFDSSYSSSTSLASFVTAFTDQTGGSEDSEFQITHYIAGAKNAWFTIEGTSNNNPSFVILKNSFPFTAGYTGTSGSMYAFLTGAQGYYFDDDIYIDEASPGGVFLKDAAAACFKCSLASASAYTITNGTTDRAFDANTQCQVHWTASTILAADQYLTQLRAGVNWVRVGCNWAGGTAPSVTVEVEECDSAGASCSTEHTAITCDGGSDSTTTFSSASAATDAWIHLDFGTPSGVPGVLTVTVTANDPTCELADALGSVIADLDTLNVLGTSTDRTVSCASATCPTVSP